MIKSTVKALLQPAWRRLDTRLVGIAERQVVPVRSGLAAMEEKVARLVSTKEWAANESQAEDLGKKVAALEAEIDRLRQEIFWMGHRMEEARHAMYASDPTLTPSNPSAPFMTVSNCQASDFFHPRFEQLCKLMGMRPHFHRKIWEWVYVLHKLQESGILRPGAKGLVFGVGREPLPAVFAAAGVEVTATDAPPDVGEAHGWEETRQYSHSIEQLLYPAILPETLMREKVSHRFCDMNNIDPALTGYDFNWSSCCFEHLGTLEHGLQFVINAVEKTLKPGGVAVHTTEYNVSSNDDTVTEGETVIYRRRDIEELINRLRARGHEVEPFTIGPTAHVLDYHVDVPPYVQDIHLKLRLAGYVATSVGIVARRARV